MTRGSNSKTFGLWETKLFSNYVSSGGKTHCLVRKRQLRAQRKSNSFVTGDTFQKWLHNLGPHKQVKTCQTKLTTSLAAWLTSDLETPLWLARVILDDIPPAQTDELSTSYILHHPEVQRRNNLLHISENNWTLMSSMKTMHILTTARCIFITGQLMSPTERADIFLAISKSIDGTNYPQTRRRTILHMLKHVWLTSKKQIINEYIKLL